MRYFISLLALILALAPTIAHAQTVTVKPLTGNLVVGTSITYKATTTGLTNTAVTWSASAGTITTAGKYTAPAAIPTTNPVTITATSVQNTAVKGTAKITIIPAGPHLTAVSPDPIAVGAVTVTIKGTGFLDGAVIHDITGSNTATFTLKSHTSTSITATGIQIAGTKASFEVKNTGSGWSNMVSIPIQSSSTTYALTVVSGSGSGSYTAGTVVPITANAAPSGQVFNDWTGATVANATSASTTITMPAAPTTVTANYKASGAGIALQVINGTGSGNYAQGAVVTITAYAAPSGKAFLDWNGYTTAFPWQTTTTLVMPSYPIQVQANYLPINSVTIPFPVTTHPRLWITQSDLTRLRSWAVSTNPVYQQGMVPLLQQAVSVYNTQFFPGGQPNPNYPDPGDTQGYDTYVTEQYAFVLAFNSLIDPNTTNRITYAQDARNLVMYAMNQAVLGQLSGADWRDPLLPTYNRANGDGEQWPLIVDWIYNATDSHGNPILTASDKATIRTVFLNWANDCLNAYTDYDDRPQPEGVTNSLSILPNNLPYRMASNNYYLGHARLMTMMALCMDPSDDPPVNASLPASQLGNTLRSYILDANGAWLYQEWAMMGEPSAVTTAYHVPNNATGVGYGLAAGGLPPEGMLYGHSYGFILGQLLALQTAGFNNTTYSGPQIAMIGSPVWDRFVQGYISSFTPSPFVPASETYLGPVYQMASYGDLLRQWVTPETDIPFDLLDLLDKENGNSAHDNEARWVAKDAVQGGSANFMARMTNPWSWSSTNSILNYMVFDPTAPAVADPRPNYPTVFVDPGMSRIVAHTDWTTPGTFFDYLASWISIYHQNGNGGQFELFDNGDWLTKEMSNYDNNLLGFTTTYHNTLALQNWCQNGTPTDLQWYEGTMWSMGSQWMEGNNAGDPSSLISSGPGYVYATSDLHNLYNRPSAFTPANAAMDITQATRSIVWLNNDYVVVYDRATSTHNGFKKFNYCVITNPVISGNTVTDTLADGHRLYAQTLLPASPTITSFLASTGLNPIADLEPTNYIVQVQSSATTPPADIRFLHVLQGANNGVGMVPAVHVQSAAGTAFDGAAFGTVVVYFPVNTGPVNATVFPIPTGVHTMIIAGLTPGAGYSATLGTVLTLSGGSSFFADSAGLLRLTF